MADTSIEWADKSWNFIRAQRRAAADEVRAGEPTGSKGWFCVRVSPGCENCYAASTNRFRGNGIDYKAQNARHVASLVDERTLMEPFRWRKSVGVFPCSMTDLWYEGHTDEMIDQGFAVMALARRHTFRVLTKRIERARDYLSNPETEKRVHELATKFYRFDNWRDYGESAARWVWPAPNIWIGTSIEDQRRCDERLGVLATTPAALRWVSFEPLLEPVVMPPELARCVNWGVVGGESRSGAASARPFDAVWGLSLVGQLHLTGGLAFAKQLGSRPVWNGEPFKVKDPKGGKLEEWPAELAAFAVREMPERVPTPPPFAR
jgi:protein gp37